MRTSEERVRELHRRMHTMEKTKDRRYLLMYAAVCTVCLVFVVAMALIIAHLPVRSPGEQLAGSVTASIFTNQDSVGYVVTALLAFFLGVLFTIFCFRLKKRVGEKQSDDRML